MRKFIIPLVLLIILTSCSQGLWLTKGEDFDEFYHQFHIDQSFQLERIVFPLEGKYVGPAGEKIWKKADWEMHKQPVTSITDPDFEVKINKLDKEVFEKVALKGSGYYATRKFQKQNGKWYLVYFEMVDL